jgi:hypothetical protein
MPDPVEGAIAGRRLEPGTRIRRDAVARPGLERRQQRVLRGVLSEPEIAAQASGQARDDPTRLAAPDGSAAGTGLVGPRPL